MDSGHASHAHVCTCVYIMYILCIYVYIYICIHTQIHAFQRHTRQADRWFYCGSLGGSKQKGGNDSSFSLSSPFGSRSFYEQSVWRGFLFFFFGTVLFLSCLRLISRVITNGDTRISAAFRFPLEEPLCVIQGRGSYFVIYLYLPVLRKWLENGVPEKNIACSRTPLFRNVFCQTVSKRSFSG